MDFFKNIFNGIPFKSREQMERERREFEDRVFPLGTGQRAAAADVLAQLLPDVKHETDRLYAYIAAKDAYLLESDPERGQAAAVRALKLMPWYDGQHARVVLALIRLEAGLSSLEEYPTPAAVREAAGQIVL